MNRFNWQACSQKLNGLVEQLREKGIKSHEILAVLDEMASSSGFGTNLEYSYVIAAEERQGEFDRYIRFNRNPDSAAVKVVFDSQGKVRSLNAMPGLTYKSFKRIEEAFKRELSGPELPIVFRVAGFSEHTIRGFYRSEILHYQIRPMPGPEAPYAIPEPVLLEVAIPDSVSRAVRRNRAYQRSQEIAQFLNLVLDFDFLVENNRQRRFWSWQEQDGKPINSVGTLGFSFGGEAQSYTDSFWNVEGLKEIPIVPTEDYYSIGLSQRTCLELPNRLKDLEQAFLHLPADLSVRFSNSLFWFYQATAATTLSTQLLGFVQAVESLLAPPTERCDRCQTLSSSLTKQFKTFINDYAPDVTEEFTKGSLDLYAGRSALAHGGVLQQDKFLYFEHPIGRAELIRNLTLEFRTRLALVNWLLRTVSNQ